MSTTSAPNANTETYTRLKHMGQVRRAQLVFGLLILLSIVTFGAAFVSYTQNIKTACLCAALRQFDSQNGLITLHPRSNGSAAGLIQDGDVLVAVDGVPVPAGATVAEAEALISQKPGGTLITLTIQTGSAPVREVQFTSEWYYWLIQGAALLGISFQTAYSFTLILELLTFGVGLAVVGLIVWRRSDDWMALYAALAIIVATLIFSQPLINFDDDAPIFTHIYFVVGSTLALGFGLLFPDGRFRPRWGALLIPIYATWSFISNFGLLTNPNLSAAGILVIALLYVGVFVYRYRQFMTPSQRQQTKWAGLGIAVAFVSRTIFNLSIEIIRTSAPIDTLRIFFFFASPISSLLTLVLPLGFMFAMLRYRLYDVDLAINRGLVYGLVTAGLGALFVLIFFVAQAVLGGVFSAGQSTIAIALSAAATALLFNPTRKRVQNIIDRRFYGFRFDLNQLAAGQKNPEIKNPGLLTGRTLGNYQVLGVLGRGGMGEVYQGQNGQKTVAIKILPSDLAEQENFRKRFAREAQTLAAFDHPNIVKVFDSGENDGIVYMAMEYVQGQELADFIRERGTISLDEAWPFVQDFAAALDYAHNHGLVHRDIKPSNIMLRQVDGRSRAVLMDFGIAKIQDAQTALTGTGAVGTIDYMAPEQILVAKEVDHRADIYALGVVLYEMLTGERPFKGGAGQVLFAHLQQPPPDPRDVKDDIPSMAAHAVLKALSKNPDDRYQSAGELAQALH